MNFCKKIMIFVLFGIMSVSFSACGDEAISQKETTEPEEAITKVLSNLEQVKSMQSVVKTQSDMTTAGSNSNVSTETTVTTVYSPLNMKIESKSSLSSNNVLVTYVDEADGMATTYMEYAGQWMKQSLEPNIVLDSLRMYDTKQNAISFLKNASNWQMVSEQENVMELQGTLPSDVLFEVVEDTKSLQVMGMAGLTEEYYKGVNDANITISIDKQTLLPVSYRIDLSNTLETLMNNVINTFGAGTEGNEPVKTTVNEYTLIVDCKDINQTKKVEIPKETIDSAIDFEKQIESATISEMPTGENGEELAVE